MGGFMIVLPLSYTIDNLLFKSYYNTYALGLSRKQMQYGRELPLWDGKKVTHEASLFRRFRMERKESDFALQVRQQGQDEDHDLAGE